MKRPQFLGLTAILLVLAMSTPDAYAQCGGRGSRGGFSSDPGAMFDGLDRDGSGVIEPQELENSMMGRMVDRMGIDTSKGITREDFAQSMEQMRQNMESGGGFGGRGGSFGDRGGFGSRGRGDEESNRDDESRGSGWFGGRERGEDRSGEDNSERNDESRSRSSRRGSEERSDSRTAPTATAKTVPPPRVTLDLQQDFVAGDTDKDGQIGLYEWTDWKSRAALAQFLSLDRNGDGFLTPKELARAKEATPVDIASVYPVAPAGARSTTARATVAVVPPQSEVSTQHALSLGDIQAVIAAADERQVKKAKYDFSLLDTNRDGSISELEWLASRKLKPRFEKAGIDLAQPMTADLFVSYYVRIFSADESS